MDDAVDVVERLVGNVADVAEQELDPARERLQRLLAQ